jgi:RNA polymerase sigma factor (sigma-70 family)
MRGIEAFDRDFMLAASEAADGQRHDDALMERVAARDGAAFRSLIDAHAPAVHRLAYRMTGDGAEAEDVTQEAMLRLWEHAARWRPGGPGAGAWLKRVAANLCLDRLRRRRFASDADVPERVDEAPLADAAFDAARTAAAARAAVLALPDRQRLAIVLTYYEGMANADAAAALELNIKAFESLLLRARAALRQACAERGLVADDLRGEVA